jgi:hypothetical protein
MKKDEVEITEANRRTFYCGLKPFEPGFGKEHDFIEVTEWTNGEGFDILIETSKKEKFSLSWGEYDALKYIAKKLNKL